MEIVWVFALAVLALNVGFVAGAAWQGMVHSD
jgi:hypothetical protein